MVGYKQILCVLLFTISSGLLFAQNYDYSHNNTNSPYTRYGYGQLADQTPVNSKAMGGIAYGLRDGTHINAMNPASYSAVDSLTFIFEGSYTLQNLNLSNGIIRKNAKNSSFDYISMQFRLRRGLGISLGFLPYSFIGYNLGENQDNGSVTSTVKYYGDGGLQQVYLGVGGNVIKNLSIGANVSYIWGSSTKGRSVRLYTTDRDGFEENTYVDISDIKFDFGAQYSYRFDKKNSFIIGAVFSPKNNLNNDTYIAFSRSKLVNNTLTTIAYNVQDTVATFGIPMKIGAGLTYNYDERLLVGMDYTYQKWSDVSYMNNKNSFYNMSKISLGVEYLPSYTSRNFFSHIKYRAGAYYSLPYYKFTDPDTKEGYRAAKEFGITAGFAIPLPRSRSVLSLNGEYSRVTGQKNNALDENYLKLTIGLTFNERWFFKRKVD